MFGFIFGTACLLGLFWMLRRGRNPWARGFHHERHAGGRFGRRVFLHGLFERLDTTPGQERAIRDAVDELVDGARGAKRDFAATREDLAQAMRRDYFDETLLGDLFAKHDGAIETLRKESVGALAKIHDALDERQRKRLADLIEDRAFGFGGPTRWAQEA